MTTIDWIVVSIVWSFIPAVFFLKAYLDHRWNKVYRETQPDIDREIKKLIGGIKP